MGIGYGHDFHRPPNAGAQGAAEYQDVKAAGEYLRSLRHVDGKRIGIYGGSYGGFLTARALARDLQLFTAGLTSTASATGPPSAPNSFWRIATRNRPTPQRVLDPVYMGVAIVTIGVAVVTGLFNRTWKSPVLLIHGDDDRNVRFSQTTDLVRRLEKAGIPFGDLIIPDDTHPFMRHANSVKVNAAVAAFFERVLE